MEIVQILGLILLVVIIVELGIISGKLRRIDEWLASIHEMIRAYFRGP